MPMNVLKMDLPLGVVHDRSSLAHYRLILVVDPVYLIHYWLEMIRARTTLYMTPVNRDHTQLPVVKIFKAS